MTDSLNIDDLDIEEIDVDPESLVDEPRHVLIAKAKAKQVYALRKSRIECEGSLSEFIKQAWHTVEPAQPYVHNWHIDFIAAHLQAITEGEINRLLINVPPGMMKSLLVNVFWPAWEWIKNPGYRFICTAHSQTLAIRDSTKMRRLIQSPWYQERWGRIVKLTGDVNSKIKFENTETGFREAVAFESMTGVRGDRVTIDDPHSVDSALSEVQRQSTINTFLEAVPTRLTNPATSAIVVIMQRLHVDDVSGVILDKNLGYTHVMLPMEYDPSRKCETELGYEDPREEEGELLFEARFPREVVERDKQVMGPWAVAGQFQQTPSPRGGGIVRRDWWQLWDDEIAKSQGLSTSNKYPQMDYIIASLDGAYTSKQENDPSALTVWGVWQRGGENSRRILSRAGEVSDYIDERDTIPCVMLMHAWEKRLPIHGSDVVRNPNETEAQFRMRRRENMGLVEHIIETCNQFNVDMLLIESKGPGLSVAQEIKRLNRVNTWGVELINPGSLDKVARAYAVQPIFSNGAVYAPDRDWADKVITQFENFPKVKHDDLCLTGETKILMADGSERRLDEICIGDFVATPQGPKRVSAANQTGIEPIWRVEFTNGYLEGTCNHPVFSNGEWIRLADLSPHDSLETPNLFHEVTSWYLGLKVKRLLRPLCSMAGGITAILNRITHRIEDILRVPDTGCTEMCGSITTGQYPRGFISIMSMETQQTMTSRILNVFQQNTTDLSILKNTKKEDGRISNSNISKIFVRNQKSGTAARKGKSGIGNMRLNPYTVQIRQSHSAKANILELVNGAVLHLLQKVLGKHYVGILARPLNQDTCLVKAVTFTHTMRPVFNLTVEDAHCYYANGVLTHNCDSTTQALKYLRERNLIRRPEELIAQMRGERTFKQSTKPVYDV